MDFIILSNQRFDSPLKTNKWQIATRLAKLGHKVIFVDPPIRIRKALRLLFTGRSHLQGVIRGYKKVTENLYVFMPITQSPTEKPNLFFLNFPKLKKLLKKLYLKDIILWVYHQVMVEYIDSIEYKLLIYDCVDEYSKFPNFVNRGLSRYVSEKEEYVARKADLVFATTENLVSKMKKYNKEVYFTPNVGDYERFKDVGIGVLDVPKELKDIKEPIIGFTGAIDEYKLNINLVFKCALKYPDYSFVLVGPIGVSEKASGSEVLGKLKKLDNVYFLGEKPYEQMPSYFEGFDVFIIPYNLNDYTLGGCFPVKFHDALSAGLPTVVTNLPSYKPFGSVCYIAKDENRFVELIEKAILENSPERQRDRRNVAKKNSYDEKIKSQLGYITKSLLGFEPKEIGLMNLANK